MSLHKYEVGFFPGTGSLKDTGFGRNGHGYAVNAPLKDGITDSKYSTLANSILKAAVAAFRPQLIFAQFGADTLIGDPMNGFNLTLDGPSACLKQLLELDIPTVILGGGGYNATNAARLWARLTGLIVGEELERDIPDHSCFLAYRPSYELPIEAGLRKDANTDEELQDLQNTILENLRTIQTPTS